MTRAFTQSELDRGASVPVFAETPLQDALLTILQSPTLAATIEHAARRREPPHNFPKTFCSNCGREFGPGNFGYSHCDQHQLEWALAIIEQLGGRDCAIGVPEPPAKEAA